MTIENMEGPKLRSVWELINSLYVVIVATLTSFSRDPPEFQEIRRSKESPEEASPQVVLSVWLESLF